MDGKAAAVCTANQYQSIFILPYFISQPHWCFHQIVFKSTNTTMQAKAMILGEGVL